jgi:hypothetical protein
VHLRVVSDTAGKQAVPMSLVPVTLNHVTFSNISLDSWGLGLIEWIMVNLWFKRPLKIDIFPRCKTSFRHPSDY